MMNSTHDKAITLAILAGGEGSRMGIPKAELQLDGEPILMRLIRRTAWPGPTLLVTAPGREHPPGTECFGREVADPVGGEGPLRGVLTALEHSNTDLVIVATVDMPEITAAQLTWLGDMVHQRDECDVILFRRPDTPARFVEPFPSIYRKTAMQMVRAQLEHGQRSMQALSRQSRVEILTAPSDWPSAVWTNLNEPSDLDAYRRR
jgi:molybdopterin-guanine dinucleotide biosynthesis protein A